jgi:hypothetical protein
LNAFKKVSSEIALLGKEAHIGLYFKAILDANLATIQEGIRMGDAQTIEKVFEEVGWIAKWEARGEARGRAEGEKQKALAVAQTMIDLGLPAETVITVSGLDPEKVKALYKHGTGR